MATSSDAAALVAFNASRTSFAALQVSDGRIRVWDASTGALRTELQLDDHYVNLATCMAWGAAGSRLADALVVGTGKGGVHFFSVRLGKVTHEFEAGTQSV